MNPTTPDTPAASALSEEKRSWMLVYVDQTDADLIVGFSPDIARAVDGLFGEDNGLNRPKGELTKGLYLIDPVHLWEDEDQIEFTGDWRLILAADAAREQGRTSPAVEGVEPGTCLKCGAAPDERWDCCEVHKMTAPLESPIDGELREQIARIVDGAYADIVGGDWERTRELTISRILQARQANGAGSAEGWVIRAPNGNVRMWTMDEARAKARAAEWGLEAKLELLGPRPLLTPASAGEEP